MSIMSEQRLFEVRNEELRVNQVDLDGVDILRNNFADSNMRTEGSCSPRASPGECVDWREDANMLSR